MRKVKDVAAGEIAMYPVFQFQANRRRDEPLCFVDAETAHEMIKLDVAWSCDRSTALQYKRRIRSWKEELRDIELRGRSSYGNRISGILVPCCEEARSTGHHHKPATIRQ